MFLKGVLAELVALFALLFKSLRAARTTNLLHYSALNSNASSPQNLKKSDSTRRNMCDVVSCVQ
jgi:hypothetical protein